MARNAKPRVGISIMENLKCDCCKGKLVPEKFWRSEENGGGICMGTINPVNGFCRAFSHTEVDRYLESLNKEKKNG